MENASALEMGWCLTGLCAVVFSFWNLTDAVADWMWLAQAGVDASTGLRKWAARRQLRHTLGMLLVALMILGVGVGALFLPAAPRSDNESLLGVFVVIGLVGVTVAITVMNLADFIERRTYPMLLAPLEHHGPNGAPEQPY